MPRNEVRILSNQLDPPQQADHANTMPLRALARFHMLLAFAIVAGAGAWLWSSLATIATFALRYPAFDQYRLYAIYLGLPFPSSAIQLENGHRPILPALLRLAEVRWFAADQSLQIITGVVAAGAALALILWTIAREHSLNIVTRAAAALLAVLSIFWLGNARILIHGNEIVQVYLVVLFLVLAILALDKARKFQAISWTSVASLCCLGATFSFGTGMASFAALLLLAAVVRLGWSRIAILVTALAIAAGIYILGLPGSAGVRNTLLMEPLENVAGLLRWLSAPWMSAWLGRGDPIFAAWGESTSARWLASLLGSDAVMLESLVVGSIGLIAFTAAALHAWRRGSALSSVRFVAFGLSTFALGSRVNQCTCQAKGR
jgi:hypothetical protein